MDNSVENVKTLTINGVDYAKYDIDNGIMYLKVIVAIVSDDIGESEDVLSQIIMLIEKTKVKGLAYLNI